MCLVAVDKRCFLNKLKNIKNIKDVSMALSEEVKNQTCYIIGSISPAGHLNKVLKLIDKSLNRFINLF